jgi:hypothetical protein
MKAITLRKNLEATFTAELTYINNPLLFSMVYGGVDSDGYEYSYTLFDLAFDPRIIDKITNL